MPSILIIAAERGLGLGLAEALNFDGWDVTGTARHGADVTGLKKVARVAHVDVTRADQIGPLREEVDGTFDVIFLVAGIFGPVHGSVVEATDAEFAEIMLTNCFGPIRLAHRLLDRLKRQGTIAVMSSHRGSIGLNTEPGLKLDLYRASKAGLNMLARTLHADHPHLTVLSIHPGWAATAMGTLDGTVEAEISVEESVKGMVEVLNAHRGTGRNLYLDWRGRPLPW
ncbi:NAD(P)-dependent dehydrogenase (short-subunit alcohol dehydrogenase family) [Neorhizobium galegae]|uniref:SDR family oxidoreductase n=1 Tax=Neorhizobium galegae TaxID=399 RepID=UPI002783FF3E|nr:SDR family oxidoreductase [Neorhizobium galegae]MDQ0132102.1 NAD(P)-dependent dehydrogenase (short-subunit alcohol dehydrogenase family) [Neorhizobium galegae]